MGESGKQFILNFEKSVNWFKSWKGRQYSNLISILSSLR